MADTGNGKHMSKSKKDAVKLKYTSFVAGTPDSQTEYKDDSPSLQEAFRAYRKARQKEMLRARRLKKRRELRKASPGQMAALRKKFIAQAKKYMGVPYARKYWAPDTEEYRSKLFLDCCGLVRQVMRDLAEDFGFNLGPWNQAYMFDTLPIDVKREQDMRPGDLVFVSATYNNPKSRKQPHNMTHVEIWAGDGPKTIGARWNNGKVQVFNHYKFEAKSYHSETYHFKSIETWLRGTCKSYCKQHRWKRRQYCPKKKSIFALPSEQEQGLLQQKQQEEGKGSNSNSDDDHGYSDIIEKNEDGDEDEEEDEDEDDEFLDNEEGEAASQQMEDSSSCQDGEVLEELKDQGVSPSLGESRPSVGDSSNVPMSNSSTGSSSGSGRVSVQKLKTSTKKGGKSVDSPRNRQKESNVAKRPKTVHASRPVLIHKSSSDSNLKNRRKCNNKSQNARPNSQPGKARKKETPSPEDLCKTFHDLNIDCPDKSARSTCPSVEPGSPHSAREDDCRICDSGNQSVEAGNQTRSDSPGAC